MEKGSFHFEVRDAPYTSPGPGYITIKDDAFAVNLADDIL